MLTVQQNYGHWLTKDRKQSTSVSCMSDCYCPPQLGMQSVETQAHHGGMIHSGVKVRHHVVHRAFPAVQERGYCGSIESFPIQEVYKDVSGINGFRIPTSGDYIGLRNFRFLRYLMENFGKDFRFAHNISIFISIFAFAN